MFCCRRNGFQLANQNSIAVLTNLDLLSLQQNPHIMNVVTTPVVLHAKKRTSAIKIQLFKIHVWLFSCCLTHSAQDKEIHVRGTLQWRHNGRDGVSDHQPHGCLLNHLFRRRSKKTPKLRVTDLCAGNSPVTGEFPAQRVSNAENVSIWWRHHDGTSLFMWWIVCSAQAITWTNVNGSQETNSRDQGSVSI